MDGVPEFVRQRLHPRCIVHVRANCDNLRVVDRHAIRSPDGSRIHRVLQLESLRRDLGGEPRPQPGRRLSFEQPRHWPLRDLRPAGLRHIPHVGGLHVDDPRTHHLACCRFLPGLQSAPRHRIGGIFRRESPHHRGVDHVPGLALVDRPVELFPLVEPRYVRRHRRRYSSLFVCVGVLGVDQQCVPKTPRSEPGRELDCPLPILTRRQPRDGSLELLRHLVELGFTRRLHLGR